MVANLPLPAKGRTAGGGERGDHAEDERFPGEYGAQPSARPGGGQGVRGPAAGQRPEDEPGDRDQRGGRGQAGMRVGAEAQEHHVAGHVRDEHPAQPQVTDGVDKPGDRGQGQQRGHGLPGAERGGDGHGFAFLSDRPGQLTAPSAALRLAMIAPPIAMDTNERRKPVPKKRHRIQARVTSSNAMAARATISAAR